MRFLVTAASPVPIYRQLMRQVEDAIASGRLTGGDQLPSHRELSEQLAIAPLTVKKAYDELEARGLLEQVRGRGTFVRNGSSYGSIRSTARNGQSAALAEVVRTLVAHAMAAGLDQAATVDLVRAGWSTSVDGLDHRIRSLLE